MTRTELADAMLKGLATPGVVEEEHWYINVDSKAGLCAACALGSALIGKHDGDFVAAEKAYYKTRREHDVIETLCELLGISEQLALEVENRHGSRWPIVQIAAWLKEGE